LAGTGIEIEATDANTATINCTVVVPSGEIVTSADFTQITVVTDVQLLSTGQLQKKTKTAYVYNPGVESAWTNAGSLVTIGCED
jgi:hypothetical protein